MCTSDPEFQPWFTHVQIKTRPSDDGEMSVNESFTFDVKDPKVLNFSYTTQLQANQPILSYASIFTPFSLIQTSALSVEVYGKGMFGLVSLGQCKSIPITNLLCETTGGLYIQIHKSLD